MTTIEFTPEELDTLRYAIICAEVNQEIKTRLGREIYGQLTDIHCKVNDAIKNQDPIEVMNSGKNVTYAFTGCRRDDKRYGEKATAWCINPEAEPYQRRYTAQFEDGHKMYPQTESSFILAMIGWNEQL